MKEKGGDGAGVGESKKMSWGGGRGEAIKMTYTTFF